MSYKITLNSIAEKELQHSFEWYEERQPGLGEKFISAVGERIRRLAEHPHASKPITDGYREILVLKFPFSIVYQVFEKRNEILIVSVFHSKRNPLKKYPL